IEQGCPPESFATKTSRVSSPNAAKTGACALPLAARLLRCFCNISLDVLHLFCPTALIPAEGFKTKVAGDIVETRLREHKQRASCGLLQPEFDKRGWVFRVVALRVLRLVQGSRMRPGEGKQPFRLHFFYDCLPFEMLVAGICNLVMRDLTRDKWDIQFHTKPFAKFTV